MHLFASFIFRASIYLIREIFFIDGVGLASDLIMTDDNQNGSLYFNINSEVIWSLDVRNNCNCNFRLITGYVN